MLKPCILLLTLVLPAAALAQGTLHVEVPGVKSGARFPDAYTFCRPAPTGHVAMSKDESPPVRWSAGPHGTKSYAIVLKDPDVPADTKNANKEGETLPASAARVDFYHWLLVDIPANVTHLPAGADSQGITPHGKPAGQTKNGVRGVNDYGGFMASNPQMAGTYAGYDGPCPPWNDERVHDYALTVYALDVPRLDLPAGFNGKQLEAALDGHVLAKGSVMLTYSTRAGSH